MKIGFIMEDSHGTNTWYADFQGRNGRWMMAPCKVEPLNAAE